jgi:hypothetical protein
MTIEVVQKEERQNMIESSMDFAHMVWVGFTTPNVGISRAF